MRTKIVTLVAAGVLGISGVAVAGPVLAAAGATGAAASVNARVDRIQSALSGLVNDGTLTQAQADRVAATLDSSDALRGPGGHGGRGPGLATAATALGLSEADLRTALESGKTLAQVAQDRGVSVDTLVKALVDAEKARIAQQVTDGRIAQAQADERLADLTARVTDRVTGTRPVRGGHENRGHDHRGHDQGGPGLSGAPAAPGAETPAPAPTS